MWCVLCGLAVLAGKARLDVFNNTPEHLGVEQNTVRCAE